MGTDHQLYELKFDANGYPQGLGSFTKAAYGDFRSSILTHDSSGNPLLFVSTLAERNDIKLVLRFNSEAMKADDRNSVLQGVNRAIVYQKNLNITNLVVKSLGGEMANKSAGSGTPVKPTQR